MGIGDWIGCILFVVWLIGVGLLAHLIPSALAEDDFLSVAMGLEPERISVLMALFVVSWPVSGPFLAVMMARAKRKEKEK